MKYQVPTKLMASYGMNTNHYQMASRCPHARVIGRLDIPGFKLVFRGVADVVEDEESILQTVLWEITPMCEEALDLLEGFPHLYIKRYLTVMIDGEECEVMLYQMGNGRELRSPSSFYEDMLIEGYEIFELDVDQIFDAPGYTVEDYEVDYYSPYTYRYYRDYEH